jgi:drug/metabolite transporter (DMT)-like permease
MTIFLYGVTVLIWGTTWIAISWQGGDVPVLISIFYRFFLASILFLPSLFFFGKLQPTRLRDHGFFVLQGMCLFSFNFICFYTASHTIISGLISVIFAAATLFNAFNQWLIWRKKPATSIYVACILGIVGLFMLFWRQLSEQHNIESFYGIAYAFAGTYLFSLGNMVSVRNSAQGIKPWTSSAYGMIYGTLILFVIIQLFGIPWHWDSRPVYVASLVYLAIPGSILGFSAYLTLVGRIGASQAAYVTVLFPVVALAISTVIEGYRWDIIALTGLVFVMLGVLLAIKGEQWLRLLLVRAARV